MAKNTKDLRELSVGELATRRRELKEENLHLRVQKAVSYTHLTLPTRS